MTVNTAEVLYLKRKWFGGQFFSAVRIFASIVWLNEESWSMHFWYKCIFFFWLRFWFAHVYRHCFYYIRNIINHSPNRKICPWTCYVSKCLGWGPCISLLLMMSCWHCSAIQNYKYSQVSKLKYFTSLSLLK